VASASGRGDACEFAAGIATLSFQAGVQTARLISAERDGYEKATPTSVPLLKFAPSLGLADVAVPSSAGASLNRPGRLSTVHRSYRHAPGKRENISIEIKPDREVRWGNGLTGQLSVRITVGGERPHADGDFQPAVIRPLLPTLFSGSDL
jgi:hypothetical protein